MAKFSASTYVPPTPAEAPNPFIEDIRPFVEAGVGTFFDVTFDSPADYKRDKLLIQKAGNSHGVTIRQVAGDDIEGLTEKDKVSATFAVRPKRKPRAASEDVTEDSAE